MSVIGYTCVSTVRQGEDGNGLEQQRRSICAFAAASGMTIDEWVTDDESGTTEDREGIQELLARDGTFTLIFDRVDRLGRTLLVSESLFGKFGVRGVRMVCVAQHLDDSPVGILTRQMMGAFAQYQRTELLIRLAASKRAAKAKRGTYGGGTVPYGFRTVGGGKLAVDPGTARLVLRTHEIARKEASLRAIAAQLEAEGFRTRKGTIIQANQVRRILERREVYSGEKNVGQVPLDPGVLPQHPAILSPEVTKKPNERSTEN